MGRNVIRRIRWGNVALATAGVAAIVIGVVWALEATTAPVLPGNEPRPLLTQEPVPTLSAPPPTPGKIDEREREPRVKPRAPRRVRRGGKQRAGEKRAEPARSGRATAATPTAAATPAVTAPPVRVTPRRSAPAPAPAATRQPAGEFGFEG